MIYLLCTSLLWAFSFGLIKGELTGLPSSEVAFIRLAVALIIFAPFLRLRTLGSRDAVRLILTGAIQYGLMYVAYIHAFRCLKAYEVALFTVFTPLYVTLINDLFTRQIHFSSLAAVMLAVFGGIVIEYQQLSSPELWRGFLLVQASNLCFAFGQIFYRRIMARMKDPRSNLSVFGLLYLGAALAAALAAAAIPWAHITLKQSVILLYLGAVASGLGFFLWNKGARHVSADHLAIFNNLKIPLGIFVSILFFNESANELRLCAGGALMGIALSLNRLMRSFQNKKINASIV
jgi:drug/metabolite transporter (DMT)-like permease